LLTQHSKALEIMKGLQRPAWQHGCADPHACGARYHNTETVPEDGKRHQQGMSSAVPSVSHQPRPLMLTAS